VPETIPAPLLELIDDQRVTDILISGNSCQVDLGEGLVQIEPFTNNESLSELARNLIEIGGRRLDQANPFADVSLPGGIRLHAVLESACSAVTLVSIRLHKEEEFSLEQLMEKKFFNANQFQRIKQIAQSKESYLISGATGSGKTTLLRAMLPKHERVIAIEDVTEIKASNVISLQTRIQNIEGQGEISLARLLKESLRMRPDRIVVGEVRGEELLVMLQALNTGHFGAATIHANSLEQVPERVLSISSGISESQLTRLTASAFDWVISLATESGIRRVSKIGKFENRAGSLSIKEVS
jgi:pilus assembly protein CpaF